MALSLFTDPLSSEQAHFRVQLSALFRIYEKGGVWTIPWYDPALIHFSNLDARKRETLLVAIAAQIRALEHCVADGVSLFDTWALLRAYLKEMGQELDPGVEVFAGPDDYIAAYDRSASILFFSPNHFAHMTYSLEDMYCRPWTSLLSREEAIEKVIHARAVPFFQGVACKTISNLDVPPHQIAETQSPGMRMVTVESKAYSCVFKSGVPVGMIAINHSVKPAHRMLPTPRGLKWEDTNLDLPEKNN